MAANGNGEKYVMKSGLEVLTEVENITSNLTALPNLIQLVIEAFELDEPEISEAALYNYKARRNMLYDVIHLVKNELITVNEELREISPKKPARWDEMEV